MFWDVKVITVPSRDSDLSLVATFDQNRYFINTGEGLQRACTQRGVGLKKMDVVLLTQSGSEVVAGLPGILMTAADSGVPKIKVAGPEDALQYLVSCRTFLQREKVSVEWLPHPSDPSQPIHNPNHLSIRAIPLSSTSHPPSFPTPRQDWEWRDVDLKLDSLSADQLAGWRRTVLADMFKKDGNLSGQAPGANTNPTPGANTNDTSPANDIIPISEGSETSTKIIDPPLPPNSADADGHIPKPIRQFHPARMHIPQPIPHPSSDATTSTFNDPDLRYAYILHAPPVRGKFDAKKASALGVEDNQRGMLIKTGSVEVVDKTAEGGTRIVKAEDVLGATQDGGAFIMVDITASHLPRLLEDPAFKEYQSVDGQGGPGKKAGLVVHRITDEVMRDERYQAWAKSFGKDTPHLVTNVDRWTDSVTFTSSAKNLLKLSILDDKLFKPVLVGESSGESVAGLPEPFVEAKPYQRTRIFPSSRPTIESLPKGDPGYPAQDGHEQAKEEILKEMPEYARLVKEALGKTMEVDGDMNGADDYGMVVTPLGTGSAIPSKYRNVSSTIVEIPDFGNIVLDAGEGTLGQMRRRYGDDLWRDILSKTKILHVSHMHADHHVGVRRILEERLKHNPTETLYLIAPSFIALHLMENGIDLDDPANDICFIDNYFIKDGVTLNTRSPSRTPSPERAEGRFEGATKSSIQQKSPRQIAVHRTKDCLRDLDLECLHIPEVEHRGRAYGLAIAHLSGWKIAYSGDTMPCDSLVEAGQGATLLIHEATLEDENAAMAVVKGHSTFGQAVDIGRQMNAKYILLNHFSQRYPKLPRLTPAPASTSTDEEDGTRSNPKVALAFDLMTMALKDFGKQAGYIDAMEELFKEEEKEEEADGPGDAASAEGTNGKQNNGKQLKPGKTPKGTGKGPSELSNSQRRKLERQKAYDEKARLKQSSPKAGEKRSSGKADDVDSERGTVKRTKSESVVVALGAAKIEEPSTPAAPAEGVPQDTLTGPVVMEELTEESMINSPRS